MHRQLYPRRAKCDHITLEWEDDIGFMRRTLPISSTCPDCGARAGKPMDTRKASSNEIYRPVACTRCRPTCFYALPVVVPIRPRGIVTTLPRPELSLLQRARLWVRRLFARRAARAAHAERNRP